MKVKVTKWGNSLALRIPRPLAAESEVVGVSPAPLGHLHAQPP